ncbi:hypothetical protein [Actinoplanes friuliensis]|uniref:Uncharacterized protein n=1 Tax=Actinoplanes friuliensis DSM 7358 TaxID=1246995 RepID=U5W5I4_9ACTN|nr:hypothetical protein [Actinoplanes friuliensis]AGZ44267.1 hypothetical protein AFR_30035 [Actinoplanes friuliensis DSM 7358]
MITTVELPGPATLWTRWATLAAAITAIGHDDVWTVGESGAHHDDGGGNWSHLALIEGDRAVLYGYDHEYSDTVSADPPVDLLEDAPAWLPWDDLTALAADDQLGYVLWHDGTNWQRAGYPDGLDDGLTSTAAQVLDDNATLAELGEFVFEWGEHTVSGPEEQTDVHTAAVRVLRTATTGELDGDALAALLGRLTEVTLDLAAGLAVATRGGLTPGTQPPVVAAGTRPSTRRVRKLSDHEHDKLVWAAMHEETERERPEPVPTGELGALVTWLRGRAPAGDGRCSLQVYADSSSLSGQAGEHEPAKRPGEGTFGPFREMGDLVRRLREAEADDAYGRWLFLHVETTAQSFTVERFYDSWPSWWEDNGISGPWRSNLKTEVDARELPWRPSWTALLDPGVAYRPAAS